jgi:hypothetical protein
LTFHQTGELADKAFYESYDAHFLVKKAALLNGIYQNASAFRKASQEWKVKFEMEESDLLSLIATELHCASFHQAETMLSLLLAEYQPRPDWVYLTSSGNAEIKKAAKCMLQVTYDGLTGGNGA